MFTGSSVCDSPSGVVRSPTGRHYSIRENPPKKYQDIYPFNFESEDWRELWQELESIARFWLERGVRIFRVDNPHTKPFGFWEYLIAALQQDYPDAIFLAEAFTRPKVMRRLAKLGFSQSYSYFTWRNTSSELTIILARLPGVTRANISAPTYGLTRRTFSPSTSSSAVVRHLWRV
jgi:starch synthase (maltosyl-transferring)